MNAVEEQMDHLDSLGGWKALVHFNCDSSRVVEIVQELPYIIDGQFKDGCLLRIIKVSDGVMVVTGGQLTDGEGAALTEWLSAHKADIVSSNVWPPKEVGERILENAREGSDNRESPKKKWWQFWK
jgi:hypothetical protein